MKYLVLFFLVVSFQCFAAKNPNEYKLKKEKLKPKQEKLVQLNKSEVKEKLLHDHFDRLLVLLNSIKDKISVIDYDSMYQTFSDLEYLVFLEEVNWNPQYEFP